MDFGNPFECPVCLDFYNNEDRIPTTLACGHSYCLSHLGMLDECCICRSSVRTGTSSAAPSFALRDGALTYLSLIRKLQALGVSAEDMADIPQPIVVTAKYVPAGSIVRPPPPPQSTRTEQQAVFRPLNNVAVTTPVASEIKSGCQHICSISSVRTCCHCSDLRPARPAYEAYVDGVGFCTTAPRDAGYCPYCKNSPRICNRSLVAENTAAVCQDELNRRRARRESRAHGISHQHSNEECLRAFQERAAQQRAQRVEVERQREEAAQAALDAHTGEQQRRLRVRAQEIADARARAPQFKSCGHSCTYSSLTRCCSCMDRREHRAEGTYSVYVDGQGWVGKGLRSASYCPFCK